MLQGSLNVILNIFFLFSMYNVGFQYKAAGQQIQNKLSQTIGLFKIQTILRLINCQTLTTKIGNKIKRAHPVKAKNALLTQYYNFKLLNKFI